MQTTAPATQAKTSYLVEVHFPTTGKRATVRWPTRRQATRCVAGFCQWQGSAKLAAQV